MSDNRRESQFRVAVMDAEQPFCEVPLEVRASGAIVEGVLERDGCGI